MKSELISNNTRTVFQVLNVAFVSTRQVSQKHRRSTIADCGILTDVRPDEETRIRAHVAISAQKNRLSTVPFFSDLSASCACESCFPECRMRQARSPHFALRYPSKRASSPRISELHSQARGRLPIQAIHHWHLHSQGPNSPNPDHNVRSNHPWSVFFLLPLLLRWPIRNRGIILISQRIIQTAPDTRDAWVPVNHIDEVPIPRRSLQSGRID